MLPHYLIIFLTEKKIISWRDGFLCGCCTPARLWPQDPCQYSCTGVYTHNAVGLGTGGLLGSAGDPDSRERMLEQDTVHPLWFLWVHVQVSTRAHTHAHILCAHTWEKKKENQNQNIRSEKQPQQKWFQPSKYPVTLLAHRKLRQRN